MRHKKNEAHAFACREVNIRGSVWHVQPSLVNEFSEGGINGEIFLIHPLAVVKWRWAKATLPKSAKAQVSESA